MVSSGDSRNSVFGPRGSPSTVVSSRASMPVDDGKPSPWLERSVHGPRQARPVRDAMKRIGHEDEVRGSRREARHIIGIAFDIIAIAPTTFGQANTRDVEKPPVDVDRDHMRGDLRD